MIIINFFLECLNAYSFLDNENFDSIYGIVYLCILIPYLAAVILLFVYLCGRDSPGTRKLIPWAVLIVGIVSLLLVFWVIIYIGFMYDKD